MAVLGVLAMVLATAGTTWFSGATFTSLTTTSSTVGAAADYKPPTVAVTSPGATVTGTVQVSATASDTASGVAQVVIEFASATGAWTVLCSDTAAPYTCTWDTTKVADGDYRLRATATDVAGFIAVSAIVTTRVANPATVVLSSIPAVVRGTVPLSATVTGAGTRSVSSAFQFRLAGTTAWTTVTGCATVSGSSPTCSWNTGSMTDVYEVRVLSTIGSGAATTTASAEQTDILVDNVLPSVTVSAPTPMSGTVQVSATATDEDSGVARVELSYRRQGTTAWIALCTVAADPYRCALNTTSLINGATYELRAIAFDEAGNSATSPVESRQVVNGLAAVTITSPLSGDQVRGTTTVTVDANPPALVAVDRVVVEARLRGGAYATVCTDTTAPYSCSWATSVLATGTYELRATMTYGLALTATSSVVTVGVDNTPLRALDVQGANGGTLGRAGAGDTLTFTYEGAVDLTSIKAGWSGASTSLDVVLSDKNVATATTTDRATFSVALGAVTFAQNYVRKNRSVTVASTMTASTTTVGGFTRTVVVVSLGASASGDLVSSNTAGAMRWTPSAAARSTNGTASSTTPVTESGASDRDL